MDTYAKELEKAIFNWYYGGENAAPESMFNAMIEKKRVQDESAEEEKKETIAEKE